MAEAPLLGGSVVRSDEGDAEANAIKAEAVWGDVGSIGAGPSYPPIDVSNSWFGQLVFWFWTIPLVGFPVVYFFVLPTFPWALWVLFAPLILITLNSTFPFMLRLILIPYQLYAQINLPFQPSKGCLSSFGAFVASVLLTPTVHIGVLSALIFTIARVGAIRFRWWDLLNDTQGGLRRFLYGEGIYWLEYEKVRSLTASDQSRGPYMGASILDSPSVTPNHFLLFLDGEHHKAVRTLAAAKLLDPAKYQARAAELPRVLAPLLPDKPTLDAFVDSEGVSDPTLLSRMVARCLWFLVFGEAGLLDVSSELDTIAAWYSLPKPMVLPRSINRLLSFGLIGKSVTSGRKSVLELLKAKGLTSVFQEMNAALPGRFRRKRDIELADELMIALNFAGINGTTQLLRSVLAALRGRTYECPPDSLSMPDDMVSLFNASPDRFMIEACRVDPPVTSACCLLTEQTTTSVGGVLCGTRQVTLKKGTGQQYVFGGIAGPNRDPAVFHDPNVFKPSRPELYKLLSWNGALDDPLAYPRFCPGQQIAMLINRAILKSIEELKPADWSSA